MFAAVLDTCVLWPSLQRDFLLSLAVEGLYRPLWSSAVLAELQEHEARKLVRHGADRARADEAARRLIDAMHRAFDDACVSGWEPLEGTFGLPDPDDEHLIATAVIGGAGVIVTENLRDLPSEKMPPGVQVVTPREFALETVEVSPTLARRALTEISLRSHRTPRTVDELLAILDVRYGMSAAVSLLRQGS